MNENPSYDFGAMTIAPNSQGYEIGQVVGYRGIWFNVDPDQYISAFGYPAAFPFDGKAAFVCESWLAGTDPFVSLTGPPPLAIVCDMTQGSSGGGWIVDDEYLMSVNSYGYPDLPGYMFGPYLDDGAEGLWDFMTEGEAVPAPIQSPTPTPTPTATPPPTAPPVTIEHPVSLKLTLKHHLIANVRMTVSDGYNACRANAPVGVFRWSGFNWKRVKSGTTNSLGVLRLRLPDKPGWYEAYGMDGLVDDHNLCAEAVSREIRHRH